MLTDRSSTGVSPSALHDSAGATRFAVLRSGPLRGITLEWVGQTVASLCWLASVFVYGLASAGDWLQLGAASAWLVANIASVRRRLI